MSETIAEYKAFMAERRARIEPRRVQYAREQLSSLDLSISFEYNAALRCFIIADGASIIRYYPYTGWFTGKSVKDGRGIHNLIKQLKDNERSRFAQLPESLRRPHNIE